MKISCATLLRLFLLISVGCWLAACETAPVEREADPVARPVLPAERHVTDSEREARLGGTGPVAALQYHQALGSLSAIELARDRAELLGRQASPDARLRLAMLLTHPRSNPQELARAQGLLNGLLKSPDPAATALLPLTRLLLDQIGERQRLEILLERQGGHLRETQGKAQELQLKLDRLADIERILPKRRHSAPAGGEK